MFGEKEIVFILLNFNSMMKRYILLQYVRQGSCWWKIEVPPFEVNWHFNKKAVCTNPSSYWLWRWQNILLVSISTILCCKVEMSRSTACWAKNSRQFHQQKYAQLYQFTHLEFTPNFYIVHSVLYDSKFRVNQQA